MPSEVVESNANCCKAVAELMAIEYLVYAGLEPSDITIALGPLSDYGLPVGNEEHGPGVDCLYVIASARRLGDVDDVANDEVHKLIGVEALVEDEYYCPAGLRETLVCDGMPKPGVGLPDVYGELAYTAVD